MVKPASQERVAAPTAHSLSSALSPQLPMRTMKRAKALDPQRLREAERFALEALGASNDSIALYEVGGEFSGSGGDDERPTREEERKKKDQEWEHLMQGLSANASHSRDGLDAIAEVVGDDARQHQHQHQMHDRTRHHQARVEEDDEEVKRKTATLEQLLAQLEVNAPDDDERHDTLSASSSLASILIPDEEAAPATMVVGNTLQHHHHHHDHYRFGLPTSPGGQLRSVSSPALFGPAPTAQDRSLDMRLLNEQLNDGCGSHFTSHIRCRLAEGCERHASYCIVILLFRPMLPNDRDAMRLEQSAPPGTCARCTCRVTCHSTTHQKRTAHRFSFHHHQGHQPIPVGAPRLKALDRTYHSGCWYNDPLSPLEPIP